MIFKVFSQNLNDNLYQTAKQEAKANGFSLNKSTEIDCYTILSIACQDEQYLPRLIKTLEKDCKTKIFAIKGPNNSYIDFKDIQTATGASIYNLNKATNFKKGQAQAC